MTVYERRKEELSMEGGSFFHFMCSRNLFVLDFTRRFFVRCVQIFEAYAVRTLMKFERGWRKIGKAIVYARLPIAVGIRIVIY